MMIVMTKEEYDDLVSKSSDVKAQANIIMEEEKKKLKELIVKTLKGCKTNDEMWWILKKTLQENL